MSDPADSIDRADRLKALEDKIRLAKGEEAEKHFSDEHHSQVQHAWRMVIELVSGVGIGFGIGYGLDSVFDTLPIFLLIFTLLGLVAGIRVMMRTANEMQRDQLAEQAKEQDAARSAVDEES